MYKLFLICVFLFAQMQACMRQLCIVGKRSLNVTAKNLIWGARPAIVHKIGKGIVFARHLATKQIDLIKQQKTFTKFTKQNYNSTVVLSYATASKDKAEIKKELSQLLEYAKNNIEKVGYDVKMGLFERIKLDLISKNEKVIERAWHVPSAKCIFENLARLPEDLQYHYATIIKHLVQNKSLVPEAVCNAKCPLITIHTKKMNNDSNSEIISSVITVNERCIKDEKINATEISNLNQLITNEITSDIKKDTEKFEAIRDGKIILLPESLANNEQVSEQMPTKEIKRSAFEVLGLNKRASELEIKSAYFKLRMEAERNMQTDKIEELKNAYFELIKR